MGEETAAQWARTRGDAMLPLASLLLAIVAAGGPEIAERVARLAETSLDTGVDAHSGRAVLAVVSSTHGASRSRLGRRRLPWAETTQCWNGDTAACGPEFVGALDGLLAEVRQAGQDDIRRFRAIAADAAAGLEKKRRHTAAALLRVLAQEKMAWPSRANALPAVHHLLALEILLSRPGWSFSAAPQTDTARGVLGLGAVARMRTKGRRGTTKDDFIATALVLGLFRTAGALLSVSHVRIADGKTGAHWGALCVRQPLSMAALETRTADVRVRRDMRTRLSRRVSPPVRAVLDAAALRAPDEDGVCAAGMLRGTAARRDAAGLLDARTRQVRDEYVRALAARAFLAAVYGVSLDETAAEMARYEGRPSAFPEKTSAIAERMVFSHCTKPAAAA